MYDARNTAAAGHINVNTDIASGGAHGSGLINDNADAAAAAHNNNDDKKLDNAVILLLLLLHTIISILQLLLVLHRGVVSFIPNIMGYWMRMTMMTRRRIMYLSIQHIKRRMCMTLLLLCLRMQQQTGFLPL